MAKTTKAPNWDRVRELQEAADRFLAMEGSNDYYKERERKNEELVVTMGYAAAFGFGLMCLVGIAKLLEIVIRCLF